MYMGFNSINESSKSDVEVFVERLESLFGKPHAVRKAECLDGGVPIHIFYYYNLPKRGMITSVTYGLSEGNHPDWQNGRPELMVTVKSEEEAWGFASAFLATNFRGEKPFGYGDLFALEEPIAKDSNMVGYFVFAPSILNQAQAKIELPTKTVYLTGMYPLYSEEIELFKSIGIKEFFSLDGYDLYDVKRKNLGSK